MKKNILVLALDIEMSGSIIRTYGHSCFVKQEGDIIGIGGSLVWYNKETKTCEEIDRLFVPMLCLGQLKTSEKTTLCLGGRGSVQTVKESEKSIERECVLINYADKKEIRAITLEGEEIDPTFAVNKVLSKDVTIFEQRCWDEFWSKRPTILKTLETREEEKSIQHVYDMAKYRLVAFRKACERRASDMDCKLVIVSDNVSYDIGMLEKMLQDCHVLPFVYRLTDEKYNGGTPCTHSMQKGLLAAVDPLWLFGDNEVKQGDSAWMNWLDDQNMVSDKDEYTNEWWSLSKRIQYLYHIPEHKPEVEYDHNSENDAFAIACEYLAIHAIGLGHYILDSSRTISVAVPVKMKKIIEEKGPFS